MTNGGPEKPAPEHNPAHNPALDRLLKTTPKVNIFSKMLGSKVTKVDTQSWTAKFLLLTMIIWLAYFSFFSSRDDERLDEFLDKTIKGSSEFQENVKKKVDDMEQGQSVSPASDNLAPIEPMPPIK